MRDAWNIVRITSILKINTLVNVAQILGEKANGFPCEYFVTMEREREQGQHPMNPF